jgi:D-alanyl-D-alanine carboxypeptidase
MILKHELLQNLLEKSVDGKKVFGVSFALARKDRGYEGGAGNLEGNKLFFIASTTKLFTTALIMQLRAAGKLKLDDCIDKYLPEKYLQKLHLFKGRDFSKQIKIIHLLGHTSGLADYFQGKQENEQSLELSIKKGVDRKWTFEDVLEINQHQHPLFEPGSKGKANYSDTNFQLLGKIIEQITEKSYEENCKTKIINPLGLENTYLYCNSNDIRPQHLFFKSNELIIPEAMTSFGPDGGMVSTSADLLFFIQAFFKGNLFPVEYIQGMQNWNKIFFPMQAGVGIHLFKLPWFFNPFGAVPSFIGHSGLSGALAFYCPKSDLYIAGTVNQVAHPDLSFRLMIQLERLSGKLFK